MRLRSFHYLVITFLFAIFVFSVQSVSATVYEHSFKINDIKVSEDSTDYIVDIFFKHDYPPQTPYTDDNWDIMIAWAWGPYAGWENLEGYDSASAYLTQHCYAHPLTVDQVHNFCHLEDLTTTDARLSPIEGVGSGFPFFLNCPDNYKFCCFDDTPLRSGEPSAGGYVLLDDIKSGNFTDANSGDILLEIRFKKEDTDWNKFKKDVLNDIYIIMDYVTSGDDVANFVWSPDENHVDHEWYFRTRFNKFGVPTGCVPYGTEGDASSLLRLADSMDENTNYMGICDDWTLMGSNHEEFYKGFYAGVYLKSFKYNNFGKCDPHIARDTPDNPPDGGGSSTCTDICDSGSGGGVAWASEEKILGRDVGMSCDKDNDYSQCYYYDCDFTDNTCIKCNGKIQSEGKTGMNSCEMNCGADPRCDEKAPGTFGCSSNCCFADLNGDGNRNIMDISIVASAFGSNPKSQNWKPVADLDGNGVVNIVDLANVASQFGKSC